MKELVSVVMAVFNSGKFIVETVERIVSQTYAPIEIIIVDDESTDNTVNVVRGLSFRSLNVIFWKSMICKTSL